MFLIICFDHADCLADEPRSRLIIQRGDQQGKGSEVALPDLSFAVEHMRERDQALAGLERGRIPADAGYHRPLDHKAYRRRLPNVRHSQGRQSKRSCRFSEMPSARKPSHQYS